MSYANLMQWFHTHAYGYALNLMQAVTDYMHQVLIYNNKNSHCENNFSLKEVKNNYIRKTMSQHFCKELFVKY